MVCGWLNWGPFQRFNWQVQTTRISFVSRHPASTVLVSMRGLEPPTSPFRGEPSNQLTIHRVKSNHVYGFIPTWTKNWSSWQDSNLHLPIHYAIRFRRPRRYRSILIVCRSELPSPSYSKWFKAVAFCIEILILHPRCIFLDPRIVTSGGERSHIETLEKFL